MGLFLLPVPRPSGIIQDGISRSQTRHRLTLIVTDSGGRDKADSIGLTVNDVADTCGITPTDGRDFTEGPIAFAGTVEDIDQDADGLDIQWESSIDGISFRLCRRSGVLSFEPICPLVFMSLP